MKLKKIKTKIIGRNYIHYDTIDSTQNEIWRLIQENAPSGTMVVADIQKQGKGTHGRKWYTEQKNNIAFSFFIKPNCDISKVEKLTINIAKIILEIFQEMYQINLKIKEPNDIVYNDKKIGGILTESKVIGKQVNYLVVGVGINTSQEEFHPNIKEIATSIKKEFDVNVDIENFIIEFCNKFEENFTELCK